MRDFLGLRVCDGCYRLQNRNLKIIITKAEIIEFTQWIENKVNQDQKKKNIKITIKKVRE